ncbi:MAG: GAF domain-containing protein [Planctomycetota bacterium]|jgi:DNA-binding response OmpR family regulator
MMPRRTKAQILVVDDEADLRELLFDALSSADTEVVAAGSGREAVELARRHDPDLVVADIGLGDRHGPDVIDELRGMIGDVPAVVITGCSDAETIADATRVGVVELMTKPLDVERLRATVRGELKRQSIRRRTERRALRLRDLARDVNIERKLMGQQLDSTCADLTAAYRTLSGQMALQQIVMSYQNDLIAAANDDDVFRSLFQQFVRRSGPVYGIALVCDAEAELRIVGRFGVPKPDSAGFCGELIKPMVDKVLDNPHCEVVDLAEDAEEFDQRLHRYLPGMTGLAMPLVPAPGELIGLIVLYRKGEQPFTDVDLAMAEMIAHPTAVAVRRND